MKNLTCFACLVFFLASDSQAQASDRHFVLIFGSQQIPPNPNYCHSFATFVKVKIQDGQSIVTHHTISWLPASGQVRFAAPLPERGQNYLLHETVGWALATNQRISVWGPYEVTEPFYRKSIRQYEILEQGKVKYKAVDYIFPNFLVTNCIHAVSETAGFLPMRIWIPNWGETASWHIARRFRPWMVHPHRRHVWVANALGLDAYPIVYRDWRHPRSGLIYYWVRDILGIRHDPATCAGPQAAGFAPPPR